MLEDFGTIIYQDERIVIRHKRNEDGSDSVYVHQVAGNQECLPHGYILGYNSLWTNRPKKVALFQGKKE